MTFRDQMAYLARRNVAFFVTAAAYAIVVSVMLSAGWLFPDVLVTTARRAPDSPPSDQVLVAFCKGDYRLESTAGWDTLGMRGTCSAGFNLEF